MIRPRLDRDTLGPDFSVNLAFVKCDPSPQVYTMRESKVVGRNVRNCQGGWLTDSDSDVFDAAARESFEEICPITSTLSWKSDVAERLRCLYSMNAANLSVHIYHKLNRWDQTSCIYTSNSSTERSFIRRCLD